MPPEAIERGALVPSVVKSRRPLGQVPFEKRPTQIPLALASLASLEHFCFLLFCLGAHAEQRSPNANLSRYGAAMPSAAIERVALVSSVVKTPTVVEGLTFEKRPPQIP